MSDTPDRVKRFFEQRKRAEEGTWTMPESVAPGSTSRARDLPRPPSSELQQVHLGSQILPDHVAHSGMTESSDIPPMQYPMPNQRFGHAGPGDSEVTDYVDPPMDISAASLIGYTGMRWLAMKAAVGFTVGGAATLKVSPPGGALLLMIGMMLWVATIYTWVLEEQATRTLLAEIERREQEAKSQAF